MNDKIIINIISKTYFAVISFFVFMFLTLSISFIALQNGIFIGKMHIQNIELTQLYIKWNEKIDISLKELKVSPAKQQSDTKNYLKNISKYLNVFSKTTQWFNSVIVEKISFKDAVASFKYKNNEKGFLLAKSNAIDINASIFFKDETMILKIIHASDAKRDLKVNGAFYFDTKAVKIYTNINIKVSSEADFTLYSIIDKKKLKYKFASHKDITSITNIINMLHLPKHLHYWVYEAVSMSSLHIDDISGFLEYNDLNNAYKHLNINSTVDKLAYKYNKKLKSINSSHTKLQFKNGILYVKPYDAYMYGFFLDKSWLKIDFTQKEELLTLNLLMNTSINKDIIKVLKTYKIVLPFVQNSGSLKTDVSLKLWLQSLDVNIVGDFTTKKANIDYLGLNLDVYDANVHIDGNEIFIQKMGANYGDIAQANVKAHYNAKTNTGLINFKLNTVHLGKFDLYQPMNVTYNITPKDDNIKDDSIIVANSRWSFNSKIIDVKANTLSFNIKTLKIALPPTFASIKNIGDVVVWGTIDLNTTTAKLSADITHFTYDGIALSQSHTPIQIKYDKYFSFESADAINFSIVGTLYKANKIQVDINEDMIYLKHTLLNIGKYITTKIYANYNTKSKKSHISLNNFILVDPNTQKTLYENTKILLSAYMQGESIKVNSTELEAEFTSKESGWKLYLNSIDKIARNSDILKKYSLNDGKFDIYKNKKDDFTRFKSKIIYPYKILVKANKPLNSYTLKGKIYKEKIYMIINDIMNVKIKDRIDIDATNCVVNINEVLRAIGDINGTKEESKSLEVSLKLKDSYLYINKKRKLIYDNIDLKYTDEILTANLNYNHAYSYLRLKNKKFHLYGSNFNDVFMNNLFSLTKFNGGALDFSVIGDVNDYNGVLYVHNTMLKDYKVLNNILAFVNTVPSLITFSLPGYNKDGLFIDKSYVKFNYKKKKFDISNIYVDSKEIDILGTGMVDVGKDYLDLVLNLKTDLGSDLAKIPVVGYILLNGKSISTTLSVKGKISNPKVKSLIAKEIIVAPFNIIKRTLLLPYKLFKDN